MGRFIKVLLFIIIGVALLVGGLFLYRLISTDAPVLHGEHEHHSFYNELELDLYYPTTQVYEKHPVLMYIHGGAWVVGSKISVNNDRFHESFNALREKGYAIVAPDYTLGKNNASPFPDCIQDAKKALEWVYAHAEEKGLDASNIGLLGESAGAHIAMMVAYDSTFTEKFPVNYLIDVYGPSSLYQLYLDQQPLIDSINARVASLPSCLVGDFDLAGYLFGFNPKQDTSKARSLASLFSPVSILNSSIRIPNLLIHGNEDQVVPVNQSSFLMKTLDQKGISYEYLELDGVDHAFRGITEDQKAKVQDQIVSFVLANKKE